MADLNLQCRETENKSACGCGSVLCYGCRSAKTLLLIARDLERLYPHNQELQERAKRLRAIANEWLVETSIAVADMASKELRKRVL